MTPSMAEVAFERILSLRHRPRTHYA